jgi:hypothetical protein
MCACQWTEQGDVQRDVTANPKYSIEPAWRLTVNPVNYPEWNPGERLINTCLPCTRAGCKRSRTEPLQCPRLGFEKIANGQVGGSGAQLKYTDPLT